MQAKNEIVQELMDLESPLASFPRSMPFLPPAQGFEANALAFVEGTLASLREEDPVLPYSRRMPFEVPAAYFEMLADEVLENVAGNGASLSKQPSFEAPPAGYFEHFAGSVLDKIRAEEQPAVAEKPQTKIIRFPALKSVRWAAAAVLLIAIGLGTYRFLPRNGNAPVSGEHSLAGISEAAISDYVQNNIDDVDREMMIEHAAMLALGETDNVSNLDKNDIVDYLNENGWN